MGSINLESNWPDETKGIIINGVTYYEDTLITLANGTYSIVAEYIYEFVEPVVADVEITNDTPVNVSAFWTADTTLVNHINRKLFTSPLGDTMFLNKQLSRI